MKAFFFLAMLVGLTPVAAGAASHQTLSFVLNSQNASTQRLPHYRAAAPIAVRVAGDARKFDAVTVTATGPDGLAIRTPLARTETGFEGALRLVTPGAWTVALTTRLGPVSDAIGGVSVDVEPSRGSQVAGYATMVLAFMLTATGVLVLARRDLPATALAALAATKRS